MIQRIQSIYLFIAALLSGGLIFLTEVWSTVSEKIMAFDLIQDSSLLHMLIPILFGLSAVISLFTIFKFNDRKLQFVLGRINILTNFLLLGVLIYVSLTLSGETAVSEKGIGMFIPLVVVVLIVLANKAIMRDENLVKSADRLR